MTYTQTSLATLRSKAGSLLQKLYSEFGLVKTELDALGETVDTLSATVQNSNLSATHKITRSATIVIAASDSSEKSKAQADYVCDGTDDQVEINAAIAALPTTGNVNIPGHLEALEANQGGTILLLEGSYQISDSIDGSGISNLTIAGIGPATVIYNASTDGSHAIQAINTGAPKNRVVVRDLTVVGNDLSGDGIHLNTLHYQKVLDVFCIKNGGNGISITGISEDASAENKIITNVNCLFNKLDGLHLETLASPPAVSIHETLIANSHFEENYRYNIGLYNTIDVHISNCSVEDCHGTYGLYSENGHQLKISNTIFEDDVYISGASGAYVQISNCYIDSIVFPTATTLKMSNSKAYLGTSVFSVVDISSSYLNMSGTMSVSDTCSINGGVITSALNHALNMTSNNARVTITGANIIYLGTTFGVSEGVTGTRLLLNSNNWRTSNPKIDSVEIVQINGNLMVGSGTMTVENMNGILSISNNILSNQAVTVKDTCSPTAKQFVNNLGGTVTDNSV